MSKGWFDDQIKYRIESDQNSFERVFADLSSVILGKSAVSAAFDSDRIKAKTAIGEILKYYRVKPVELAEDIEDIDSQLEYLLQPTGIMCRRVKLQGKWWRDGVGPMLGRTLKGETVALIPKGISGYHFFDYEAMRSIRLSAKTKGLILKEAYCFYRPMPPKKAGNSGSC